MKREHRGHAKNQALSTYVKLMRAAESVTARVHKHLASAGLTLSQFDGFRLHISFCKL